MEVCLTSILQHPGYVRNRIMHWLSEALDDYDDEGNRVERAVPMMPPLSVSRGEPEQEPNDE